MFEAVKLGRTVSKASFREQESALRTELLDAQRELRLSRIPVVVLVAGAEAAGKGEVVNCLNDWLDTRGMQTFAFWDQTDEELARPKYWKFWRTLPPRGEMAILFGGWYLEPIELRYKDQWTDSVLDDELSRIVDFERMLTLDGALIIKFWFHLSESAQRKRLKELARDDRSRWKVLNNKTLFSDHFQKFEQVAERVIRHTDRGIAPWYLIEATDDRYRDLTVGKTLLNALRTRLTRAEAPQDDQFASASLVLPDEAGAQVTVLEKIDLAQKIEVDDFKREMMLLRKELNDLAWQAYKAKRSTVIVFEGVDAGGKGGAIRRITDTVDARLYRTIPIAAPTDEEKAHHYLWRFWRHLPRAGYITIYDRSWYGRVLVERVEGFAKSAEWRRAYAEINEFENQLVEAGVIVVKLWLHISQDEQLARFEARKQTSYKQHKITDEDWRNREKWGDYRQAVSEMISRTSTDYAPWHLIAGNDKPFARISVLRTLRDRLAAALGVSPAVVESVAPKNGRGAKKAG